VYLKGVQLESCSESRVSWLRFSLSFPRPSKQVPEYIFKWATVNFIFFAHT